MPNGIQNWSIEQLIHAMKACRGYADDGEGAAGEHDGFANDSGIGVEDALPKPGAQDDVGLGVFAACKTATEHHGQLEDVEEVGGDGLTPNSFGLVAPADGSRDQFVVCGDIGK